MRRIPRASPTPTTQRQHRQQLLLLFQREQGLERNLRSRMRPAPQLPRYVTIMKTNWPPYNYSLSKDKNNNQKRNRQNLILLINFLPTAFLLKQIELKLLKATQFGPVNIN